MKLKKNKTSSAFLTCSIASAVLSMNIAFADSATWTGTAADGNLWSNVNNWAVPPVPPGTVPAAVPGASEVATFDINSAAGTIDLEAGVTISRLTFNASAPSLTIGAGAVNSQTLALTNTGDGINGAGASAGTTLTINAALTVTGTSPRFLFISQPTVNIAGNLTTTAASGTTMLRLNDSGVSINGVVSDGATALMGLQLQQNSYNLNNSNNSFTGGILIGNSIANIATLSTTGNNSAIGAGGTIGLGDGFGYGVVNYTGTGGSVGTTDRIVNLVQGKFGGRLTQAGTGLLKFEGNVTATSGNTGAPTLQLQGNTAGTGEISGSISDDSAAAASGSTQVRNNTTTGSSSIVLNSVDGIVVGANITGTRIQAETTITAVDLSTKTITLSQPTDGGTLNQNTVLTIDGVYNPTAVAKSGTGTWTLSGANTYTGGTTVTGGTLTITGSLADATTTISGTSTVNGTGTLTFNIDGTTTDVITMSAGTLNIADLTVNINPTGAGLTETEYILVNATGGTISGATFAGLTGATGYELDYDTLGQVKLVQTGGGTTFATWIDGFGLAPGDKGFNFDADGDGMPNGVEGWFGTNPSTGGPGLTQVAKSGNIVTFTHPEADPALSDITGSYEWSMDLQTWNASTATEGLTTVTIAAVQDDPTPGTTTVTATITGTVPDKIFVRGVATQP